MQDKTLSPYPQGPMYEEDPRSPFHDSIVDDQIEEIEAEQKAVAAEELTKRIIASPEELCDVFNYHSRNDWDSGFWLLLSDFTTSGDAKSIAELKKYVIDTAKMQAEVDV